MKDERPFKFPEECPQKDTKIDNGVIVDVVEHELNNMQTDEQNKEINKNQ